MEKVHKGAMINKFYKTPNTAGSLWVLFHFMKNIFEDVTVFHSCEEPTRLRGKLCPKPWWYMRPAYVGVCAQTLKSSFLKLAADPVANAAILCIIYPYSSTRILTAAAEQPAQKVPILQLKDLFS